MVAHAHIMRVRAARAGRAPKRPFGVFLGRFWVVLGRFGSLVRSKTLIIIQGQKALLLVLSAQQRSSARGLFFPSLGQCYFLRAAWAAPAA